jgi:serine/threonine protein kinase
MSLARQVYVGLNEDTGQFMAVKALSIGGRTGDAETLYHEIELMRKLEHPNIVRYLGAQVRETAGIEEGKG